jgi:hypothetical protein
MRSSAQREIRTHFQQIATGIFWTSDLSNFVGEHRQEWGEFDLSVQQVVKFLLKEGLLLKAIQISPIRANCPIPPRETLTI